jgi:glycine hydroxymethyltransferase
MHIIAAKGIAFEEALQDSFVDYQKQIVANAKTMAAEFLRLGYKLIGNRTDNHLMLIDVKSSLGITGKEAEEKLGKVNITCNKNSIPNDTESPMVTSGIRIGTPAITTMGLKEKDCIEVVQLIHLALTTNNTEEIKNRVLEITRKVY